MIFHSSEHFLHLDGGGFAPRNEHKVPISVDFWLQFPICRSDNPTRAIALYGIAYLF